MRKYKLTNNKIKEKAKDVKDAQSKLEELYKEISDLENKYNSSHITSAEEAGEFFNGFHLHSLHDFHKYENGGKKDFPIAYFQDKTKIRKELQKKISDSDLFYSDVKIKQVDLILEKINLLSSKI